MVRGAVNVWLSCATRVVDAGLACLSWTSMRPSNPGIRPVGSAAGDQKRVVDVAQAFDNGADYIVVGRPVRDAADPRAAAEAIQKTISEIFPS